MDLKIDIFISTNIFYYFLSLFLGKLFNNRYENITSTSYWF